MSGGQKAAANKRREPVTDELPARDASRDDVAEAIRETRTLRDGLRPKGLDWKELRDQGRR